MADPCPQLAHEIRRADRWNLAWRLIYSSTTIGEAAVALTPIADRDTRRAAAVGASQSLLAASGMFVMPLRLDHDGCDLDKARTVERATFWRLQVGSLIVNTAGAITVGELTTWPRGALSFALGYTVGLVQSFTLPRLSATITATPVAGGWAMSLAGTF